MSATPSRRFCTQTPSVESGDRRGAVRVPRGVRAAPFSHHSEHAHDPTRFNFRGLHAASERARLGTRAPGRGPPSDDSLGPAQGGEIDDRPTARFAPENEFRIALMGGEDVGTSLHLEIGDLSGIAKIVRTKDLGRLRFLPRGTRNGGGSAGAPSLCTMSGSTEEGATAASCRRKGGRHPPARRILRRDADVTQKSERAEAGAEGRAGGRAGHNINTQEICPFLNTQQV